MENTQIKFTTMEMQVTIVDTCECTRQRYRRHRLSWKWPNTSFKV